MCRNTKYTYPTPPADRTQEPPRTPLKNPNVNCSTETESITNQNVTAMKTIMKWFGDNKYKDQAACGGKDHPEKSG